MEDSTDYETSDSESGTDGISEEKQTSDAKPRSVRDTANSCEPEMYHGVMVKPLSSFGEFETDLNSQEWPWVCDRTSGEVHKDMKLVSKLYNQDLKLPSAALEFIMQSPTLQEEARWEKLKAVFHGLHPKPVQARACTELEKLTILEASRIICKETSTFAQEAILKPMNDIACNDDTAKSINREIETMRGIAERAMQQAREALALAQKEIYGYNIYTFDKFLLLKHHKTGHLPLRKSAIEKLSSYKIRYIEARLFAFQLEHATVRLKNAHKGSI